MCMPNYRSVLLSALNSFALNSPSDGYDWGDYIPNDSLCEWVFDDLTDSELYGLLNHYLNYMKGE